MADYYFNFPPITSLTIPQQAALNEPNPIALSGGPGTGKSFVSLWRHISNHRRENPIKSQLLTFTTSLAYYLKASSGTQNETAATYVDSTQNWYYNHGGIRDEIIVDEAQDMPLEFYQSNNQLRKYSARISYGADNNQILKSSSVNGDGTFNTNVCSPTESLNQIFHNSPFPLDRNFRNTKRILQFANTAFANAPITINEINSCREQGDKPSLIITNRNIALQNSTIKNIIEQFNADQHNIGILTPLANSPWAGGEILTARYYYNLLNNDFDCSFFDFQQERLSSMKNIHITPFKSAKGLEFDTVIIPCFNYYNTQFNVINWRDFFVGVTRAKSNLFLFSENDIPLLNNVVDKQILTQPRQTNNNDLPF